MICFLVFSSTGASLEEKTLISEKPILYLQGTLQYDSTQLTEIYSTGRSENGTSVIYSGQVLGGQPVARASQEIYLSRIEIPGFFLNAGFLADHERQSVFRTDGETEPEISPSGRVNDTISAIYLNRYNDRTMWLGIYNIKHSVKGVFKVCEIKGFANWRTGFSYNEWLVEQQISSDRADIHAVQYNGYKESMSYGAEIAHSNYKKLHDLPHYYYLNVILGANHSISCPEYTKLEKQIDVNRAQRFTTVYQYLGNKSNTYSLNARYGVIQLRSSPEIISDMLRKRTLAPRLSIDGALASLGVNLKDSLITSVNKWDQIWDQTTRERIISDFDATTELTFTIQFLRHLFLTGTADYSISGVMERTGFDANIHSGLLLCAGGAFKVGRLFMFIKGSIPSIPETSVKNGNYSLHPRRTWSLTIETAILQ